jgi:hypothetical protein
MGVGQEDIFYSLGKVFPSGIISLLDFLSPLEHAAIDQKADRSLFQKEAGTGYGPGGA